MLYPILQWASRWLLQGSINQDIFIILKKKNIFLSVRAMGNRNNLFKHIHNRLKTEYDMEEDQAKILAKLALVENMKLESRQEVEANNICNNINPTCDSTSPFRTTTGVCNNLKQPHWGALGAPFSREIGVGRYNPDENIAIIDRHANLFGANGGNKIF